MAKTILLADGSSTIRKVVELTFSDTDIRVESVASGAEALDRLAALPIDLVLADVGIAEPSGYEICRRVKASENPVPVVLMAGTFEAFDERRAAECGADGRLVKPFESTALVQRVLALLTRSEPVPEPEPVPDEQPAAPEPRAAEEIAEALHGLQEEPASPAVATDVEPAPQEMTALELHPSDAVEPAAGVGVRLSAEDIDAVARAVVERLAGDALREIAWEVVPQLAETIIRERIRQLEREIDD